MVHTRVAVVLHMCHIQESERSCTMLMNWMCFDRKTAILQAHSTHTAPSSGKGQPLQFLPEVWSHRGSGNFQGQEQLHLCTAEHSIESLPVQGISIAAFTRDRGLSLLGLPPGSSLLLVRDGVPVWAQQLSQRASALRIAFILSTQVCQSRHGSDILSSHRVKRDESHS